MIRRIIGLIAAAGLTLVCLLLPYAAASSSSSPTVHWSYCALVGHLNVLHWPSSPLEIFNLGVFTMVLFVLGSFFAKFPLKKAGKIFYLSLGVFGLLSGAYVWFEMNFILFAKKIVYFPPYYLTVSSILIFSVWSLVLLFPRTAKSKLISFFPRD